MDLSSRAVCGAELLQESGKLVKTTFILRYLQSQPLRRRIHAQLNKGEQLHALRAWLWFEAMALSVENKKMPSKILSDV
ncbi:Tn3 family transposase [Dyadobacter psychrotolerans]|uniref:Tn3 transposase DDE domain-containing protein n=1 Tax=Dyadobacter psychrotolerans TaxID=2541721 RepID=A0A4R5DBR5_9BACT|nr:hypothetical protein E0F88_26275 [Dyadobacter psychrotolerans]